MRIATLILVISALAAGASAQQIGDRATLNALLTSSTTEDFESFAVNSGSALVLAVSSLDSTTITNGQGAGLVEAGATYVGPSSTALQWNGNAFQSLTTKTLMTSLNPAIRIDYAGSVQAMGLDAKGFSGLGYGGFMDVYGAEGLVGTVSFNVADTAGLAFVGYQHAAGITSVVVRSGAYAFSPIIDNHTYGDFSPVPEPATMALVGLSLAAGVGRRLRKARRP